MSQSLLKSADIGILDLFGTTPNFKIQGRKKHYSFCGLFLTLVVTAFIVWALVLTSGDLIDKTNPTLVASELPGAAYNETFILSPDTFAVGVGLFDMKTGAASVDKNLYTVRATLTNLNEKLPSKIFTYLDLEVCTSKARTGSNYKYWCVKDNQTQIDNIFVNRKAFLQIDFFRCTNGSTGIGPCKSPDEIDATLKRSMAQVEYLSWAVDPSDYQRPLKSYFTTEQQGIMTTQYKTMKIYMKKLNFVSDNGWLLEHSEKQHVIHPENSVLDSVEVENKASAFFTFTFYSSGNEATYTRKYLKIQDILAQVSGLAATFILIVGLLGRPYDEFKMYEKLINSMYDIRIKKSGKKGKNSRFKQMATDTSCKTQENLDTRLQTLTLTQDILMTKRSYIEPRLSTIEEDKVLTKHRSTEPPTSSTKPLRILDLTPPEKKDGERTGRSVRSGKGTFRLRNIRLGNDSDSDKSGGSDREERKQSEHEREIELKDIEMGKIEGHDNTTEPRDIDTNSVITRLDSQLQAEGLLGPLGPIRMMSSRKETQLKRLREKNVPEESVHKEDSEEEQEKDVEIEVVMAGWENSSPTTGAILQQKNTLQQPPSSGNVETEPNLLRQMTTQTNNETTTYQVRYRHGEEPGQQQLNIGYLEWLFSFVRRSQKMKIFDRGMEELLKNMDIITLVKKLGEIEKLKACILNKEQRVLFDNLRKPRLFVNWNENKRRSEAMEENTWQEVNEVKAYEAYRTLKSQGAESALNGKLTSLFEKDEADLIRTASGI